MQFSVIIQLAFIGAATSSLIDIKRVSTSLPRVRSPIVAVAKAEDVVENADDGIDEYCDEEQLFSYDPHHHHHHHEFHLFHNYKHQVCYPRNSTVAQLNKGKTIINVNAANDDENHRPLFDALSRGFRSVETGVWLLDDENYSEQSESLYVGRNNLYLAPDATLESLYLHPLEKLIDELNCKEHPLFETACDFNGLFYDSPEETFLLYIKLHTDAARTYTALLSNLKNLVNSEYLTYFDFEKQEVVKGPITIILTGESIPYEKILEEENSSFYGDNKRYIFVDAPLERLPAIVKGEESCEYDYSKLSVTAGASLEAITGSAMFGSVGGGLTDDQERAIRCKSDAAHELGLLSRVYYLPEYPRLARNHIYEQLIDDQVDILNVVDIDFAYHF